MRSALLAAALAASAVVQMVDAAYCHGNPDPNAQQNQYPVDTAAPVFVRQVPNGKAYTAGQPGFQFNVVHVYGTAYEMGKAHGQLYPAEVQAMANATWNYMVEQVAENLQFLPTWLADLIGNVGLDVALDVLIDLTKPYTGAYFYEELQGIADGAGVDYKTLCRIHLIGELTQGDCSMIGAWGPATAGGKTLQLRALDWDTDGPFKDHPAVVVYHPTTPGAHPFANVGFLSWIGTLSGQSSQQMAVSEIGVSFPDTTHFGSESFVGTPFVFLLRDILEFDKSYTESVSRIQNANRTCDLILGVGDGKAEAFRGFAYSGSEVFVYDDTNLQPWNNTADTWHPRIPNVVYWGMDWLCPGYSLPLSRQISNMYGRLTPELIIQNITSIVQTGDVHAAVYDLTEQQMYVSFMARDNSTATGTAVVPATPAAAVAAAPQMAYDRQWTQLNLTALFAEPAPSM